MVQIATREWRGSGGQAALTVTTRLLAAVFSALPAHSPMPTPAVSITTSPVTRAGSTAPLVTIGALTFVPFTPQSIMDRFTVLPIQIFNWTSKPQAEFHDLAAAGIVVLLAVLLTMNSVAIVLRQRAGGGRRR